MHFGATLRLLRMNAGLSLRDLGGMVGVSNAYLSRVENGHDAPPTPDRLAAIAHALELPATTLIELADKIVPLTSDYLEREPAARELMLEILQRQLGPAQLARIRAFVEREFPIVRTARTPADDVTSLFAPARVVASLACRELDDAIDVAAARIAAALAGVTAFQLASAIRASERACSTVVGGGLAVPYAIVPGVEPCGAVVTLRRPLPVPSLADGKPLRVLLVHVHPGGAAHTRLLATMARLADADVVARLAAVREPSALLRALSACLG